MTPETNHLLNLAAARLLTVVAPELQAGGYGQSSIGTLAMTIMMSAQAVETAADTRVWENAEMRRLLKDGSAWGPFESVGATETSLKISALNEVGFRLKRDLIRLHEAVEADARPEARTIETAILAFLKESADRRRLYMPG